MTRERVLMQQPKPTRWALVRDMAIFQVKLALDAVRDLFLSPVAIICGLADILLGHTRCKGYFQKLMNFGHKTDTWLNLFGDHKNSTEIINKEVSVSDQQPNKEANVDQLFTKIETLLKEQHNKGSLSSSAKGKIDRYLNTIINNKDEQ